MLSDLEEDVLCEMANRLNPYSKVVDGQSKKVLFSFTNFKEDRMMAFKALSLSRFLEQLINESDDWCYDLKSKLAGDEMDKFKSNLLLFKDYFLRYDKCIHAASSSHTGKDELPPLDFISKWSRYETLNSTELNTILNRNLLYKTNQQSAL
jgi:phage portal protein BeeE